METLIDLETLRGGKARKVTGGFDHPNTTGSENTYLPIPTKLGDELSGRAFVLAPLNQGVSNK